MKREESNHWAVEYWLLAIGYWLLGAWVWVSVAIAPEFQTWTLHKAQLIREGTRFIRQPLPLRSSA